MALTVAQRSDAIGRILERIDATLAQAGEGFPHYADADTGIWTRSPQGDWTGGFWCGMLWLAAARTGKERYRRSAIEWAARLAPRAASQSVFKGFLFWYGAELGNVLFGDRDAHGLAMSGAKGLATMFNPGARLIGLGSEAEEASSVGPSEANIDALPGTIPLLFTAAKGLAESYDAIARQHLAQHIELCVRSDGSVCQSATFAPDTGELVRRYTHKGSSDDSTWARAQAWAMLGLAQGLARGAHEHAATAARVAHWWIAHAPADRVAYWDFDDPAIPAAPRDTSATAIAAASMLKLSRLLPEQRERYFACATETVARLVEGYLTPVREDDARPRGVLTQGCFNKRTGTALAHELIWGDYFLLESLLVLEGVIDPECI